MLKRHIIPAFFVSLTACGNSGPNVPPITAFPPPGSPEKTVMINAGTGERVLRFTPKAESGQRMHATLKANSSVVGGGQQMNFDMGMDFDTVSSIGDAKPDGSFRSRSITENAKATLGGKLAEMGADPATISAAMQGMATMTTVDSRGRILEVKFEGDNPLMQQLQAGLEKIFQSGFVPLPEEAVGPGAEWDALGYLDAMGVEARLAARYKLVSLAGSKVKLAVTMRGIADPQVTHMPNVPIGVDLSAMSIEGDGTLEIDLEHPTVGRIERTMKITATMSAQGQDST